MVKKKMNNEFNVDCVFASSILDARQDVKRKNATIKKEETHEVLYNECYY